MAWWTEAGSELRFVNIATAALAAGWFLGGVTVPSDSLPMVAIAGAVGGAAGVALPSELLRRRPDSYQLALDQHRLEMRDYQRDLEEYQAREREFEARQAQGPDVQVERGADHIIIGDAELEIRTDG